VILSSLGGIVAILGLVTLLLKAFCLIDCATRRAEAFTAAGRQTKVFWLIILGIAVAWNLIVDGNPIGIVNIIGIIAALVYFLDVRPNVREASGGSSGRFGFGRRRPPSDW
jgi:hypothetical protein